MRIVFTESPSPCAISSPRFIRSSSLYKLNTIHSEITIRMPAGIKRMCETAENPPTRKSALIIPTSGNSVVIPSDTAFRKLLTATPPSITVVLDAFIFCAVKDTRNTAKSAPRKEAPAIIQPLIAPHAQQIVTASPAPAFTPMIPGEASLLASTPCITVPDTASPAPASRHAAVLGSLIYQKILPAMPPPFFPLHNASQS